MFRKGLESIPLLVYIMHERRFVPQTEAFCDGLRSQGSSSQWSFVGQTPAEPPAPEVINMHNPARWPPRRPLPGPLALAPLPLLGTCSPARALTAGSVSARL